MRKVTTKERNAIRLLLATQGSKKSEEETGISSSTLSAIARKGVRKQLYRDNGIRLDTYMLKVADANAAAPPEEPEKEEEPIEKVSGINGSCPPPLLVEAVDHPEHYGGGDNPYEAIKVIEAWDLNFNLGNAAKYIARAGKKKDRREDLEKALWYMERELSR